MEDGEWRMEDGGWRMKDGGWRATNNSEEKTRWMSDGVMVGWISDGVREGYRSHRKMDERWAKDG